MASSSTDSSRFDPDGNGSSQTRGRRPGFHLTERRDRLDRACQDGTWDVLVIGGGASGLGCALASAARGYSTLLLEQADLSSGTSSRSTKLIHGGVRYLRQGNVGLVRQALIERGKLIRSAPHLVKKLAHLVPVFSRRERFFYGSGLKIYDLLAGSSSLGASSFLSKSETLTHCPFLKSSHLRGSVQYFDAQFDDSRLAVSLARSVESLGGLILTYARVDAFVKDHGRLTGAIARDLETDDEIRIKAQVIINATGVFSDALRSLNQPSHPRRVLASRGTHIVLPLREMSPTRGLLIPKTRDGRVLFLLPWHGVLLAGTTDIAVSQATLEPAASRSEVEYILEHLAQYLEPAPSVSDCLSVFAGLRPLIKARPGKSTASLSREHAVVVDPSGLVSLMGGKWTTFRLMGEDTVDTAARVGGLAPTERKDQLWIADCPRSSEQETFDGSDPLSVYGRERTRLEELCRDTPALGRPLHPRLPYRMVQITWAVREEYARTVEDVLSRRTRALILDASASLEAAPAVARLMAQELGKDVTWEGDQVRAYSALAANYTVDHLQD